MSGKTGVKLKGAEELSRAMKSMGPTVAKKASDTGTRKTAQYLARKFRAAAPRNTGQLRSAIKAYYSRKTGVAWVGLKKPSKKYVTKGKNSVPFFYKILEFGVGGTGKPLNPFFEKTWNRYRRIAARRMVKETEKALYDEAVKVYQKTLNNRGS